jgi:hypothetical protein
MPAQDGTGPNGQGPRTGRQMGNCEGASGRFFCRGGFGRRCGIGFRRGFGFRSQTRPIELTKEEQKKILESEKAEIEKELNRLNE